MADTLERFLVRNASVRGEIVSLDAAWAQIMSRHELPANVRNCLGELCAAALLLSATLKFDGKLILQIHGDGPVALFVVECDASGSFRATVKLREGAQVPAKAGLSELVNAQGRGRFVVTLDPRSLDPDREPYQGIIPFEGDSVAQALEHYMLRSEQLPTRLWLAADDQRATGLLLQKLPEEGGHGTPAPAPDQDGWQRMQHLAATLSREEMLGLQSNEILKRLFWQEPLHAFDSRGCRFACACSRLKVQNVLKLLGAQEVSEILAERGSVQVQCDFCNEPFRFDAVDCAALFSSTPTSNGPQTRQ
jgi:molecular chaperone Hsp33